MRSCRVVWLVFASSLGASGLGVALFGGAGTGSVAGLIALASSATVLLTVLTAAMSPGALRACRRGLRRTRRPTAAQLDELGRSLACTSPTFVPFVPFEPAPDLRLLTIDQLVNAWRDSEAAVSRPSGTRALRRAVEERGRYLEELERRQPGLVRAWLACAAGTPGGPLPFTTASRLEAPTIDWDELIGGQATDR